MCLIVNTHWKEEHYCWHFNTFRSESIYWFCSFEVRVHRVRTWRSFAVASLEAHAHWLRCCLFTNQAWNIPLCWPAQLLYLRHWSLRQDADWLLSAGERWWKYLQSSKGKKWIKPTNTEQTHSFSVFLPLFSYSLILKGMFDNKKDRKHDCNVSSHVCLCHLSKK